LFLHAHVVVCPIISVQKYSARRGAPDDSMEASVIDKHILQEHVEDELPVVWHDFRADADVELCLARKSTDGLPCALTATYGDGPTKLDMKYCSDHKDYEGFKAIYVMKSIDKQTKK
jgi:hypothetical protein